MSTVNIITLCLCCPPDFTAVSQFYTLFEQVTDTQLIEILKTFAHV